MEEEANLAARRDAAQADKGPDLKKPELKLIQGGEATEPIDEDNSEEREQEEREKQAEISALKAKLGLGQPQKEGQPPLSPQDQNMLEAKQDYAETKGLSADVSAQLINEMDGSEEANEFIEENTAEMTNRILRDSGEGELAGRLEEQDFQEKRQEANDRLQELDKEVMANVQEGDPTPEVLLRSDINDTLTNEELQQIGVPAGTIGDDGKKGTTTSDKMSAIENFITENQKAIKQREASLNAGYLTQLKGFAGRLFSKNKREADRQEERNAIQAQDSLDKLMNLMSQKMRKFDEQTILNRFDKSE